MSFLYNWLVSNSTLPDSYIQSHFQFLEAGFIQPPSGTSLNTIESNTAYTYTPEQFAIGKVLSRQGTGGVLSDITPSASSMVSFLQTQIPPVILKPGFYFDVSIRNQSNGDITLSPGAGVVIGSSITLQTGKISTIRVFITDIVTGSESIYLSLLGN